MHTKIPSGKQPLLAEKSIVYGWFSRWNAYLWLILPEMFENTKARSASWTTCSWHWTSRGDLGFVNARDVDVWRPYKFQCQWIGWRENLQEREDFPTTYGVFLEFLNWINPLSMELSSQSVMLTPSLETMRWMLGMDNFFGTIQWGVPNIRGLKLYDYCICIVYTMSLLNILWVLPWFAVNARCEAS